MRVLLVTKPLSAPWDDSGKLVPAALARVAPGDVEFRVLVARGDSAAWPEHVRAIPAGAGAAYRTGWRTRLGLLAAVLAAARHADLLHFFFQPHPAATRGARLLARLCRRPTVHTVTSAPRARYPWRLLFADRTVALSRATAERLAPPGGRAPCVVPPALVDEAPPSDARREAVRRAAGLAGPFALYPGDYEFSGGHDLLLEAWRSEPQLPTLVLAGRDKTRSAAGARDRLAARARHLGLGERARLLGRVDDMAALVAAAEVLLFPAASLYAKTDVPLVLLEAWRARVPVVVRDLPPLAEAVGAAGLVAPPEPGAWAEAARGALARREAWGEAGRRRLEERFSARRQAESYRALYGELLDAAGCPADERGSAA